MRPGPDAEIVAVAPIDEIVPALAARPRVVRDFIVGEAAACEALARRLVERAREIVVGQYEIAARMCRGKGGAGLDRQLIEGEMVSGEIERSIEFALPCR